MGKIVNNVKKCLLAGVALVATGASAFAVDPTDMAGVETALDAKWTVIVGYAVAGIVLYAAIRGAMVLISWFSAARAKK